MNVQDAIFQGVYKDVRLISVNKKYKGSQMFSAHKDYLTGLFMRDHGRGKPAYKGPVSLFISIQTKKDIDNNLKMILDCLQDAGIIADDKQIVILDKQIVNRETKINGKDSFSINLYALDEADFNILQEGNNYINESSGKN